MYWHTTIIFWTTIFTMMNLSFREIYWRHKESFIKNIYSSFKISKKIYDWSQQHLEQSQAGYVFCALSDKLFSNNELCFSTLILIEETHYQIVYQLIGWSKTNYCLTYLKSYQNNENWFYTKYLTICFLFHSMSMSNQILISFIGLSFPFIIYLNSQNQINTSIELH